MATRDEIRQRIEGGGSYFIDRFHPSTMGKPSDNITGYPGYTNAFHHASWYQPESDPAPPWVAGHDSGERIKGISEMATLPAIRNRLRYARDVDTLPAYTGGDRYEGWHEQVWGDLPEDFARLGQGLDEMGDTLAEIQTTAQKNFSIIGGGAGNLLGPPNFSLLPSFGSSLGIGALAAGAIILVLLLKK